MYLKKVILLFIFVIGSFTISIAQISCNKKEIQGWWQLYKVETLDGRIDTSIQEPTYFYLNLKSLGRIRGPVFNGESYGHYWGKYRVKNGQFRTSTKVYYPDFIGKNGKDVLIFLSYFNMANACNKLGEDLVISFSNASVAEKGAGIDTGKLYYKPFTPK